MKLFDPTIPWYKANLHTHTTVSDGKKTPEETEQIYRDAGYQVLALSDHRKISPGKVDPDFILLSATELDTFYETEPGRAECFHIIGLNLPQNTTFETVPRTAHPQLLIDRIRELGGIAYLAHPQWSLNQPESMIGLQGIFAAEVYNSVSAFPWNADRADSSGILDLVASKGRLIPQIATDDSHWYAGEHCTSYTMIQAKEFTVEGILDALNRGQFYASQGPCVQQIEISSSEVKVTCSPCARAIFYSNSPWIKDRAKDTPEGATEYVYQIGKTDRFLRIELMDKNGKKAWISPFPVERKDR